MSQDKLANEIFIFKGRMDQLIIQFDALTGQFMMLGEAITDFIDKVEEDPDIPSELKAKLKILVNKLQMAIDNLLINKATQNKKGKSSV